MCRTLAFGLGKNELKKINQIPRESQKKTN